MSHEECLDPLNCSKATNVSIGREGAIFRMINNKTNLPVEFSGPFPVTETWGMKRKKDLDFVTPLQVWPLPSANALPVSCRKQPEEKPHLNLDRHQQCKVCISTNNNGKAACKTLVFCYMALPGWLLKVKDRLIVSTKYYFKREFRELAISLGHKSAK